MSEPMLISPMLDNFVMGDPISDRNGVRSCPAMDDITGKKYIVKIISTPASSTQLDAMLLSGAFSSRDDALAYYEDIAKSIVKEVSVLKKLADLEGFMAFDNHQFVPMDDGNGYDVYLLGTYKMSLAKFFRKESMTQLQALNLGLDMCAALSVCRRLGYLYVDLKPENIYLTTDNGFRIGDLGFIKLDSLKFASLPDRYRSAYTAPELADPFATLNETMDVYAIGAILYQAFSGGQLPVVNQDGAIAPPDFADYEMAEIILKACDPNPENRWEDPAQMGHALVDYMQRNGAHNTPIVPAVLPEPKPAVTEEPAPMAEEEQSVEETADASTVTEEVAEEAVAEEPTVEETNEEITEEADETLPGMDAEDLEIGEVSEEVSEILSQADALLAHEIPEPVVAPEPIEVTLPEETPVEEPTVEEEKAPEVEEAPAEEVQIEEPAAPTEDNVAAEDEQEAPEAPAKPKRKWLGITISILLVLALLAGGYFFYKYYYIQTIDSLTCVGEGTSLTVSVETAVDNSLLTVVCTDTYGNKLSSPVVNGVANFQDLVPDAPYTITVEISGFHGLNGETSVAYATPKLTIVKEFEAFTGNVSGSVVLRFAVEGPDSNVWIVKYAAAGGEEVTMECTDHMVTIEGLTVGTEYTFSIAPGEELTYTGTTELKHTVAQPIIAQDLYAADLTDGVLTVSWSAPTKATGVLWSVRCYNEDGYDQRIPSSEETTATFSDLTAKGVYTVEVTADGMLVGQTITVNTAATKITDLAVTVEEDATVLTWNCDADLDGDWSVEYTIDSNIKYTETGTNKTSISLPAMIPGARYKFVICNGETEFIGNVIVHTTAKAEAFNAFGISSESIALQLCVLPEESDWNINTLADDAITDTFKIGDKAGIAISLNDSFERTRQYVMVHVLIRDEMGQIVALSAEELTWRNMWSYGEGGLPLPELPGISGNYTVSVYIDNALVGEQSFTITQ